MKELGNALHSFFQKKFQCSGETIVTRKFFYDLARLPSLFNLLRSKDKDGTYEILFETDAYNERRFKYLYVATGLSKRKFLMSRRINHVDGSHLKGVFGGMMLGSAFQVDLISL